LLSQVVRLFTGEPFVLMKSHWGAVAGIVFADAWMWSPFVMLLVLAGLVSVPKFLYEAAAIDRVSAWRRFWSITFPYVRGLLLLAFLFRTIEAFKLFDVVFLLTEGGQSTETIGIYVYRLAFQYFRTSESAALAYILLFTVIVLTNLYLYLANRRTKEELPG
jgi:multiple sugar transport system permease protein